MKNIIFTDESVKGQITDSVSENLTDSDLESSLDFSNIANDHFFKNVITNFKYSYF